MEAVVSDILQRRKQEPGGLKQTALLSLGAHAAGVAVLLLLPIVMPQQQRQPRVVMNISLGGTPGPRTGGTQMLGGRRIDAAQPSTAPQIAKNVLPSPPVPPKMTLPDPKAKPRTPPKTRCSVEGSERDSSGTRRRNAGRNSARGNRRQGSGVRPFERRRRDWRSAVKLDTTNFCCPEYIIDMRESHSPRTGISSSRRRASCS